MAPKRKRDEIDVEAIKKICTQLGKLSAPMILFALLKFKLHDNVDIFLISDEKFTKVEDALDFIKSQIDGESFGYWFPDIILKHQCYPLMKNKSKVDIDLVSS